MISSLYGNKVSRYLLWFVPLLLAFGSMIFIPLVQLRLIGLGIGLAITLLAALNIIFGDQDTRKASFVGVVSALILILTVTFEFHLPDNIVNSEQPTMVGQTLRQKDLSINIASIEDSGIKTKLTTSNPHDYPVNAKIELQLYDVSFPHSVKLIKNVFLNPNETITDQVTTLVLSPGYKATKQTQIKINSITFLKVTANK